jgi:hypothetical protein
MRADVCSPVRRAGRFIAAGLLCTIALAIDLARAQQNTDPVADEIAAGGQPPSEAGKGDYAKWTDYRRHGGREPACSTLMKKMLDLDAKIERLKSHNENTSGAISNEAAGYEQELSRLENDWNMKCGSPMLQGIVRENTVKTGTDKDGYGDPRKVPGPPRPPKPKPPFQPQKLWAKVVTPAMDSLAQDCFVFWVTSSEGPVSDITGAITSQGRRYSAYTGDFTPPNRFTFTSLQDESGLPHRFNRSYLLSKAKPTPCPPFRR